MKKKPTAEQTRRYWLKGRYGLTPEDITWILAGQGGRCPVCLTDSPGYNKAWAVDHDHDTKQVRGLLCHACNTALGKLLHSVANLDRAIQYLRGQNRVQIVAYVHKEQKRR